MFKRLASIQSSLTMYAIGKDSSPEACNALEIYTDVHKWSKTQMDCCLKWKYGHPAEVKQRAESSSLAKAWT